MQEVSFLCYLLKQIKFRTGHGLHINIRLVVDKDLGLVHKWDVKNKSNNYI